MIANKKNNIVVRKQNDIYTLLDMSRTQIIHIPPPINLSLFQRSLLNYYVPLIFHIVNRCNIF